MNDPDLFQRLRDFVSSWHKILVAMTAAGASALDDPGSEALMIYALP